jgi:hypothetical protein
MTWTEMIDRLLLIQKVNGYPKEWVIDQVELAGHPPKAIWRSIAKALNYTQFWADNWKWLPGQETDEPDPTAIDWAAYPIPEPPPPPEPIPKPVLKRKPVSAHSKP